MEYIGFESLLQRTEAITTDFNGKTPFRYTVIDNFFKQPQAEIIHAAYPSVNEGIWNSSTYLNQKNKYTQNTFHKDSVLEKVFVELNSKEFTNWLQAITNIQPISSDNKLLGAGLHQSINGAFLNVHLDFNIHPYTQLHRRINVLIYMNKDWHKSYEGYLELWKIENGNKSLLSNICPSFNRCVIFELNDKSFHGHPKPLNTPDSVSRKSLAVYYYTPQPVASGKIVTDKTIYVNTEGLNGYIKQFMSGSKALFERWFK